MIFEVEFCYSGSSPRATVTGSGVFDILTVLCSSVLSAVGGGLLLWGRVSWTVDGTSHVGYSRWCDGFDNCGRRDGQDCKISYV